MKVPKTEDIRASFIDDPSGQVAARVTATGIEGRRTERYKDVHSSSVVIEGNKFSIDMSSGEGWGRGTMLD